MGSDQRAERTAQAEKRIAALAVSVTQKRALVAASRDLARDRHVLAVAITGSVGRGHSDPNDIDLVVLTRGSRYGTRRRMYCGQRVHMLTRGIERFLASNRPTRGRPFTLRPPLADAVILWDHDRVLTRSRARQRRRVARGPRKTTAAEMARLRAELVESLADLEVSTSDTLVFMVLAADYVARCGEVYLRLRTAWVPPRKHLLGELEAAAPAFARLCRKALLRLSEPKVVIRLTRRLAETALAPAGGLTEEYEVQWD
jgi:hypothetical protein